MLQKQNSSNLQPATFESEPKGKRGRPRKFIDPNSLQALTAFEIDAVSDGQKQAELPDIRNIKRKHMNPATGDQMYSADEIEFMNALSEFKRASGRNFPTCSEILNVLRRLGYEKTSPCKTT